MEQNSIYADFTSKFNTGLHAQSAGNLNAVHKALNYFNKLKHYQNLIEPFTCKEIYPHGIECAFESLNDCLMTK